MSTPRHGTAIYNVADESAHVVINCSTKADTVQNMLNDRLDNLILCKLCLTEFTIDEMYSLRQCRCLFCHSCVVEYMKVLISEGSVHNITCPDAECTTNGVILSDEIETLVDGENFTRYKRLLFEREVAMDPARTFCPMAGCETVCNLDSLALLDKTPATSAIPVQCPTCATLFCSMCKAHWHDRQTCDENMKATGGADPDGIPFSSADDAKIKRCPICRVPIERNDGCAQMMCKHCKHVFCWYCLASLDDDFLLRHYDKGQCKNRLGHSRASVIWHRTQVVGIFAGFGVLLLVASPILLLAAPCILCCNCKPCRATDKDESDTMPSTTGF